MSASAMRWVFDVATPPTASTFAVLVVYCNFANENGRSYPAASTVAAKTKQNIKTVRAAIATLCDLGLLIDTGRRTGETGNIPVYAIPYEGCPKVGSLKKETLKSPVEADQEPLSEASEEGLPISGMLASAASLPEIGSKPTQKRVREPNRTNTPDVSDETSAPQLGAGKRRGSMIPVDWAPTPIDALPADVAAIVRQWPAGAYASHAAAFHRYHRSRNGRAGRSLDWDAAWCARIAQLGAAPIRDARAGLSYADSPAGLASTAPVVAIDRAAALERTAVMYERMGRRDDAAEARRAASGGR